MKRTAFFFQGVGMTDGSERRHDAKLSAFRAFPPRTGDAFHGHARGHVVYAAFRPLAFFLRARRCKTVSSLEDILVVVLFLVPFETCGVSRSP